jgi:hypothetical protein
LHTLDSDIGEDEMKTIALALIRIARAAQLSADDACIHADLYESLKEIDNA